MEKTRTCPVCGKEFIIKGKRKYCSEECSEKVCSQRKKTWGKEYYRKPGRINAKQEGAQKRESSLQELARKAREAGMTYGQYVAMDYARIRRD